MTVLLRPRVSVDRLTDTWQLALDQAVDALAASNDAFPPSEHGLRARQLREERRRVAERLTAVARTDHLPTRPWLAGGRVTNGMLGLPASTEACIFDLDGVLADSGVAHAAAWATVLDDFLLGGSAEGARPFDPVLEYDAYFDARTRDEGIYLFLASRGIRPTRAQADALSRAKSAALERILHRRGVTALHGARRYLEAAGHAGHGRAVVSGSQRTAEMVALAGLDALADVTIGAAEISRRGLRTRPEPDILLAACEALGVEPDRTAALTHTARGVAAALEIDSFVVGVAVGAERDRLAAVGAQRTAESLEQLLAPGLRAA